MVFYEEMLELSTIQTEVSQILGNKKFRRDRKNRDWAIHLLKRSIAEQHLLILKIAEYDVEFNSEGYVK